MNKAHNPNRRDWVILLALGLIGGGTFLGIEIALIDFPPLWIAALRISIAAAFTALIWRLRGGRLFLAPSSDRAFVLLPVISLLSTVVPFSLISWGQQHVTSGFAGVAMASSALIVAPLAHVFADEVMSRKRVIGLLVGFAGVTMLIGPGVLYAERGSLALLGQLACLAAASCYAVSSIIVRRLPPIDPVGLAAVMLTIGSTFILPAAYALYGWPGTPGAPALTAVLLLALMSTAGSNMLGIVLIRSAGPTFMGLTNYMTPVFSIAAGAVVLDETITGGIVSGFFFIMGGLVMSEVGRGAAPREDSVARDFSPASSARRPRS